MGLGAGQDNKVVLMVDRVLGVVLGQACDSVLMLAIQEETVAVVHCRGWHGPGYHEEHHGNLEDLPDGYIWYCCGPLGVEDMQGADLEEFHNWKPLLPCSCGYVPA